MKKLLAILIAVVSIVGCVSVPTVQSVNIASNGIGAATAAAVSQMEMDKIVQNNIINIMNVLNDIVPTTNSTYVSTWTPVVDQHLQKLLTDGKIDIIQASVIRTSIILGAEGIDYMFRKHPEWLYYSELVNTAVHGFINGYINVFCVLIRNVYPVNSIHIDMDAYQYVSTRSRMYIKK
jgi:hypothetical protein